MGTRNGTVAAPSVAKPAAREGLATREDMVQAARAISDQLRAEQRDAVADLKTELTVEMGNFLEKKFAKMLDEVMEKQLARARQSFDAEVGVMRKAFDDRLAHLTKSFDAYVTQVQSAYGEKSLSLQGDFDARAKSLRGEHEQSLAMVKDAYDQRMDFIQKSVDAGMQQIKTLLDKLSIPVPVVHVDAAPAPVVQVTVPETPVHVTVPPTPARRKRFLYDESGRPQEVLETDVKEN